MIQSRVQAGLSVDGGERVANALRRGNYHKIAPHPPRGSGQRDTPSDPAVSALQSTRHTRFFSRNQDRRKRNKCMQRGYPHLLAVLGGHRAGSCGKGFSCESDQYASQGGRRDVQGRTISGFLRNFRQRRHPGSRVHDHLLGETELEDQNSGKIPTVDLA